MLLGLVVSVLGLFFSLCVVVGGFYVPQVVGIEQMAGFLVLCAFGVLRGCSC